MMYFFRNCKAAIRTLPMMQYDEHHPEDIDTALEDHACDEIRYMCMQMPIVPRPAKETKKQIASPLDSDETMSARYDYYETFRGIKHVR